MTRVFDLTSPSSALELDENGQGEISFTVTNAAGRSLRARAKVVPLGSTQAGWLSVVGETERRLDADATAQFTVRVAVPAGTPEGAYNFRLDVISEENPDEDFTQGPIVAAEVATSQPRKKRFSWWIPVVAGVVLVLGGLIAWLAMRGGGKVEVPDLDGMTVVAAGEKLTEVGLVTGSTAEQPSESGAPGTVWRQEPEAGVMVAKGTNVDLTIVAAKVAGSWKPVEGSLRYVSVPAYGPAWGVNSSGLIFRHERDGTWTPVPGYLKQVSTGGPDMVWGVNGRDEIFRWVEGIWTLVPGRLKHVSVGADGTVWGVNANDQIYRHGGGNPWTKIEGFLKQISVGSADHVWGVNANDQIYRWDAGVWKKVPGSLKARFGCC